MAGDARNLARRACGGVAGAPRLAGGQQLRSELGVEPARDVAGGDVRPRDARARARLGTRHRLDEPARLPARPRLAAGPGRLPRSHRALPRRRGSLRHRHAVRAVRRRLEPAAPDRAAAGAASPRAQLLLAAESGRRGARRSGEAGRARAVRHRRDRALPRRPAHRRLGSLQRARQPEPGLSRERDPRQGGPRRRAAREGVRVGARGHTEPAAHSGRLGRRLGPPGEGLRRRTALARPLRRDLLPLLRRAERARVAGRVAAPLPAPVALYGVSGAHDGEHVRSPPRLDEGARDRGRTAGASSPAASRPSTAGTPGSASTTQSPTRGSTTCCGTTAPRTTPRRSPTSAPSPAAKRRPSRRLAPAPRAARSP